MFLSYCYYLLIVFTKSVIFYVETYVTILCIKINQFIVIVIVNSLSIIYLQDLCFVEGEISEVDNIKGY